MTPFSTFHGMHGPAYGCVTAPQDAVVASSKDVPRVLLDEWESTGWCAYAGGLIRTIDPREFELTLSEWPVDQGSRVFGRTAFGDMFIWNGEEVQYLDVHYGRLERNLTKDILVFFEISLCNDRYLDKVIRRRFYRKLVKTLGEPAADECFAFEPALAFGGEESAEFAVRVKLQEHLSLLAQLHQS